MKSETGEELERVEIIKTVASKWKDVCIAFEFDDTGSQLKNFTAEYAGHSPVEPCRATFIFWLEGNGVEVTWRKLLEIITDGDKKIFADKIKQILEKL